MTTASMRTTHDRLGSVENRRDGKIGRERKEMFWILDG